MAVQAQVRDNAGVPEHINKFTKISTEFVKTSDIPRDILCLAASHVITELRLGENYESGKDSVYSITEEGNDIALAVISERVRDRKGSIDEMIRLI